jgi:hypothetical protein
LLLPYIHTFVHTYSLSGDINQEERVNTELLKWAHIQAAEWSGSAVVDKDGSAALKLVLSSIL